MNMDALTLGKITNVSASGVDCLLSLTRDFRNFVMMSVQMLIIFNQYVMKTTFCCSECGYVWEDEPDSFCPCCDNSNIHEL